MTLLIFHNQAHNSQGICLTQKHIPKGGVLLGSSLIELPTHSILSLRKTPGKSGHELGTRGTDRLAFPHTSGIDMDRPTYITTFMAYRLNQADVLYTNYEK